MMLPRLVVTLVLSSVALAACSKNEPPPEPVPTESTPAPQPTANTGSDAEAERIAREEAARRAAMEADRAARATLADMIFFGYDDSALSAEAERTLAAKVQVLRANPTARIQIAGHADERGSLEYNVALGLRRALTAKEYITGFGIDGNRIEVTSFGEERPLQPGSTESAWARNRRDEFTVTAGPQMLVAPGS
jgi:peptidoglycan-associated lipoprotein